MNQKTADGQRILAGILFMCVQLLGSVAVGYLFFGNFPDFLGWVGAAIIVGAGLYIGWSQRGASSPARSRGGVGR